MDNLINKYNKLIITLFAVAPFVAYFTFDYLNTDFNRIMQLMSFLGVFLILIFKKPFESIQIPRYLVFYALFVIYTFFSTFFFLDRDFEIKYLISNRLIGGLNLMFIIENLNISKSYYVRILNISKKILILAFIVIIVQQLYDPGFFVRLTFGEIDEVVSMDENTSRLLSIYSWLGGYLAIGFGFIPVFLIVIDENKRNGKNFIYWIIIGITFAFLSKARWIMLNALLVFIILIINNRYKLIQIFKYLIIVPVFLISSMLLLNSIGIDFKGIVQDRILESNKSSSQHKSASTRLLAFDAFNKFYWDNPILGVGSVKYGMGGTGKQDYRLRSFLRGRSSQMHVGYLSLFYMYGLVGGGFFLIFLFLLLKRVLITTKKTGMWSPFLGLLGFAIANLTLVTFSLFEMGLIISLVSYKYYSDQVDSKLNDFVEVH